MAQPDWSSTLIKYAEPRPGALKLELDDPDLWQKYVMSANRVDEGVVEEFVRAALKHEARHPVTPGLIKATEQWVTIDGRPWHAAVPVEQRYPYTTDG